jgi:hypothetical protein
MRGLDGTCPKCHNKPEDFHTAHPYRTSFNTFVLFQISDNNNNCEGKQMTWRTGLWLEK